MNYKVVILPILICLLSSRCFQHRTNKASIEASPAEPVNETETPITSKEYHVRYDKPINGYTVAAVIEPYEDADWGSAVLTFTKGDISFSVYVDSFTKEGFSLKGYDASEEIVLQYVPKPKGEMLYDKELFWNIGEGFTVLMLISFSRKTAHNGRTAPLRSLMNMLNLTPRIRPSHDITMRMRGLSVLI